MVTHGAWEWTERALAALYEHTPPGFELIVVDNASTDETPEHLRAAKADTVLLDRNVGFACASNLGARRARGRYLCFLNSDALVTHQWVEPLRAALDNGAGAAGPRLVYPSGELQEAGSLIGRDGWTAAYGDGDDAEAGSYRFPRDVDYVSAACMMVSRRAFWQVGGFDPGYHVAYYEDADLCLSLAACGRSVRYVPASKVIHARYATGSGAAAEQLSTTNRSRFTARWGGYLTVRPSLRSPVRVRTMVAARDAMVTERVLLAVERLPTLEEEPLASLVDGLPTCRLTVIGRYGEAEALLRAGIEATAEQAEGEQWVRERYGHYDVAVGTRKPLGDLHDSLAVGQPGVPHVADPPTGGSPLVAVLARAGIALSSERLAEHA